MDITNQKQTTMIICSSLFDFSMSLFLYTPKLADYKRKKRRREYEHLFDYCHPLIYSPFIECSTYPVYDSSLDFFLNSHFCLLICNSLINMSLKDENIKFSC